jgi:signal transduction histidine kinase
VVFALFMRHAMSARENAERLSNELATANTRLREQAAQADELATTRERNRLAREIHDGVGHYLTVIKVQLEAARAAFDREPATAQHAITVSERLAGEALDELRHSVSALRTDARRAGLIEDLRQLANDSEPPPEFVVTGTPRSLPTAIEHALFRVAQEGLTNVRKHARAGHTSVTLDFCASARVRLAIADDGVGLGAATVQPERGYGLAGLRERVALLGGELRAATRAGGGCVVEVEVPA